MTTILGISGSLPAQGRAARLASGRGIAPYSRPDPPPGATHIRVIRITADHRRLLRVAAAGLSLLAASGCGTGTRATGEWNEPRPVGLPYHHVLIVGATPNSRVRRSFEEQMAEDIAKGETDASPSILIGSAMGTEAINRDTVAAMTESTGADAVLVTRLISRTTKPGKTQEKVDIKAQPMLSITKEPGLTTVFASNYTMTLEPGEDIIKSNARIESVMYDVDDNGRPVYKVAVTSKFTESTGDELMDITGNIADAISKALHEAKLVH